MLLEKRSLGDLTTGFGLTDQPVEGRDGKGLVSVGSAGLLKVCGFPGPLECRNEVEYVFRQFGIIGHIHQYLGEIAFSVFDQFDSFHVL